MRRLVVVVILAALALTLTACGGGEEPPPAETAPAEPAAPATAPDEEVEPDRSPREGQVYEAFPTDPEVVPSDVLERIEEGQAMMLYLYDSDQSATQQQDESVNDVTTDYPGLIDVLSYDVGKYVNNEPDGTITVDVEALTEAEGQPEEVINAQKVARLMGSEYLNVTFTPYIIFINDAGYMTYRIRGPVDSKILEGQVLRATN